MEARSRIRLVCQPCGYAEEREGAPSELIARPFVCPDHGQRPIDLRSVTALDEIGRSKRARKRKAAKRRSGVAEIRG